MEKSKPDYKMLWALISLMLFAGIIVSASLLQHSENKSSFSVKIVSPAGGEAWQGNTVHTISYTISGGTANYTVELYYTTDNGTSFTFVDYHNQTVKGTHSYPWTTPLITNETVKIMVNVTDNASASASAMSENFFEIDSTSPGTITDLRTVDNVKDYGSPSSNSVMLTWTAPGDDGNTGTATVYDIRYLEDVEVTESNWDYATLCSNVPVPKSAGSSESFTVTGLTDNRIYYFAIEVYDNVGFFSISNSPSITTLKFETWGDKTIAGTQSFSDTEILMNGNLEIEIYGSLTFDRVLLKIQSPLDLRYGIHVRPNGYFHVNKSMITSYWTDPGHPYWILISRNVLGGKGEFWLVDSSIHYCGGKVEDISADIGMEIYSDDVRIVGSTISDSWGVYIRPPSGASVECPLITDSLLENNTVGIYAGARDYNLPDIPGLPDLPELPDVSFLEQIPINLIGNTFSYNGIGVYSNGARLRLENCDILHNGYGAIYNSTPTDYPGNVSGVIDECVFENNTCGVESKISFIDMETVTMTNNIYAINTTSSSLSIDNTVLSNNAGGIFCTASSLDIFGSVIENDEAVLMYTSIEEIAKQEAAEDYIAQMENTTMWGYVEQNEIITLIEETYDAIEKIVIEGYTEYSYGIISLLTPTNISKTNVIISATGDIITVVTIVYEDGSTYVSTEEYSGKVGTGILCAGRELNFIDSASNNSACGLMVAFSQMRILNSTFSGNIVGVLGTGTADIPSAVEIVRNTDFLFNPPQLILSMPIPIPPIFIDLIKDIEEVNIVAEMYENELYNNDIGIFLIKAVNTMVTKTQVLEDVYSFYMIDCDLDIKDVSISNAAVGFCCENTDLTVSTDTFESNQIGATYSGVEGYGSTINIANTDIICSGTIATGIWSVSSSFTLTNIQITGSAYCGIMAANSSFSMSNTVIRDTVECIDQGVNYGYYPAVYGGNSLLTMTNCSISEAEYGIWAVSSSLTMTNGCSISEALEGIWTESSSVSIADSTFLNAERAITIFEGSILTIEGNEFQNNGVAVWCADSDITAVENYFINNDVSFKLESGSTGELTHNIISGRSTAIKCSYSSPSILNNTITSGTTGIDVTGAGASPVIQENIISNTYRGITCSSRSSPNITYNEIQNSRYSGIQVEAWCSPYIVHNKLRNVSKGIQCDFYSSPFIIDNRIDINEYGIYGGDASATINDNSIKNNKYGIWYYNSLLNLTNNTIDNNEYGLYTKSSDITINNSSISNNSYGAYFEKCLIYISNITIVNNNIVNDSYGVYLYKCPDPKLPGTPVKIINSTILNNIMDLNISDSRIEAVTSTIGIIYLSSSIISSELECTDFTPDFSNIAFADNSSKVEVSFYLTVFVKWQNNEPVNNASVTIYNKNNVPANFSTDSNGTVYTKILALKLNQTTLPDGVTFMPHRVNASRYGVWNETKEPFYANGTFNLNETQYVELVLYDLENPSISINPVFFNITNNPLLTLTGSASDNIEIWKVELSTDNVAWSGCNLTVINSTPGNYAVAWSGTVTLSEGSNTVYVRAKDFAGNNKTDSVTITLDTTPPTLITSPIPETTNQPTLTIMGKTEPDAALTINTASVNVDENGNFSKTFNLNEGVNVFTVAASDELGNENRKVLQIIVFDNTPPTSGIAYIKSPTNTLTSITGIANDDISGIEKVEICIIRESDGSYWNDSVSEWQPNEKWINVSEAGEVLVSGTTALWSYQWTPETDGVYTIKSRAVDNADNIEIIPHTITFTYDKTPPTLTNIKPSNNTETESETITVSGETDGVNVTVNGVDAEVKDGKFSATVKLGTGKNTITIIATDVAGNTNQATIIVKRTPGWEPPPTEWITLSAGVIVIALIIGMFVLYKKKIIKLKLHKEKAETGKLEKK